MCEIMRLIHEDQTNGKCRCSGWFGLGSYVNAGTILCLKTIERLRNDNTTATQRSEQKGDPPLTSQLQLNFFTIREIPCVVLPLCCLSDISEITKSHPKGDDDIKFSVD